MENKRRMMLFPKENKVRSSLWNRTSLHITQSFIPNLFNYVKDNVYSLLFPKVEPNVPQSRPSILPVFPLSYMCNKDIQEMVVFTPPSKICTKHNVATDTFDPVKRNSESKIKGPFKKAKSTQTEDRTPRQLRATPSWKIPKHALLNHPSENHISNSKTETFSKLSEIDVQSSKSIEERRKEEKGNVEVGKSVNSIGNTQKFSKKQCCCQNKKEIKQKNSSDSKDTEKQDFNGMKDTAAIITENGAQKYGKEITKGIAEQTILDRQETIIHEFNKEKIHDKKEKKDVEKDMLDELFLEQEKENYMPLAEKMKDIENENEKLARDYITDQTYRVDSQSAFCLERSPCKVSEENKLNEHPLFSQLKPSFRPEMIENTQKTPKFESKYLRPEHHSNYPLQRANFNLFLEDNLQNPAIEMPLAGCHSNFGENTFFTGNSQLENAISIGSNPFINPNIATTICKKSVFQFGGLSEPSTPSVLSTPSSFPPNPMFFQSCNAAPFLSSQDTEMDLSDHTFLTQIDFPISQNSLINTQNNSLASSGALFTAGSSSMFVNKPTEPLVPAGGIFTIGVIPKCKNR